MSFKKPLQWRQYLRSPVDLLALWIATGFGSGFWPIGPGTAGTVVGLGMLIWFFDQAWSPLLLLVFWSALFFIGVWAATRVSQKEGVNDHGSIVIDEVLGIALATGGSIGWGVEAIVAFVLFRFFDIVKIPPVKAIDRWSKKGSREHPWITGFGIIADDLAAGVQAALCLYALKASGTLDWIALSLGAPTS